MNKQQQQTSALVSSPCQQLLVLKVTQFSSDSDVTPGLQV